MALLENKELMDEETKIREMRKMYEAGYEFKDIADAFGMLTSEFTVKYGHLILTKEDIDKILDEFWEEETAFKKKGS